MNAQKKKKGAIGHIRARTVLPWKILKCKLTGARKPLVVLLYVTDRCNLKCTYCQGHWSGRKIKDYATAEIKGIVDECVGLGTVHFTIHGGEILLRDDVEELIAYMKGRGLYVNLVTNGIIFPEHIDKVRGIDSLCISLDGRETANDANRGKGSHKKIMEAIRAAKKEGFKFNVQATITAHSKGEIGYLANLAREIGYHQQFSLLLKPLKPDQNDIGLTEDETKSALREIIHYKRAGYPIFTSYRTLNNALNWKYPYTKAMLSVDEYARDRGAIRCYYGKLKLVIDADGFAYPCSSLNHEFKALNVRDAGVKAAFEHVVAANTCEACYFLTQNDWSLLLGLSPRQYLAQVKIQLKEIFNLY
ncbi:MAG: radical SAM protein [Deltaproteobacteria bacterium]|nr:radical SAM protein [Deltaproteobacteria bacterium]